MGYDNQFIFKVFHYTTILPIYYNIIIQLFTLIYNKFLIIKAKYKLVVSKKTLILEPLSVLLIHYPIFQKGQYIALIDLQYIENVLYSKVFKFL
jgi:hypothetical protein